MFADYFWCGTITIYAGFAFLLLDVWFEPDLKGRPFARWSLWGAIIILVAVFSLGFVFVSAPLPVGAYVTDGEFPAGTVISGIDWKPEFTKLELDIPNPTDRPYEDLDLVVRPTSAVAAIAQLTSISNVTFEDNEGLDTSILDLNQETGKKRAVPLVLLATDVGYRVRCRRLAPHDDLRIVLALVDMKWNPTPYNPNRRLDEVVRDPNYIMRIKTDNFGNYWLGYKDGDDYAPRPTSTEWLRVEGTYTVMHRHRTISEKVTIAGNLTIKRVGGPVPE